MPATNSMTIGQVADMSDTPATTLRYYERRGLIDPPARIGGQRRYDLSVLQRLMMIKFCRIAGLTLDDIERVIADRSPGRTETKEMAHRQIALIAAQAAELRLAKRMMQAVIACECPNVEICTCGAMQPVLADLRRRIG
jgi:DNA-binding transcriptional MerR regulator